jgi:hypothetical protein
MHRVPRLLEWKLTQVGSVVNYMNSVLEGKLSAKCLGDRVRNRNDLRAQ